MLLAMLQGLGAAFRRQKCAAVYARSRRLLYHASLIKRPIREGYSRAAIAAFFRHARSAGHFGAATAQLREIECQRERQPG